MVQTVFKEFALITFQTMNLVTVDPSCALELDFTGDASLQSLKLEAFTFLLSAQPLDVDV